MSRPKSAPPQGHPILAKLFALQDKLEWSNQRYAEKVGMPYRKLCRLRQGTQEPTLHDVTQLANPFSLLVKLGPTEDD